MATHGLTRRLGRLEGRRIGVEPVFRVHGAPGPDGRCPDCELPAEAHVTIDIDRAERRVGDAA